MKITEESIDLNGSKLTLTLGKYATHTDVSVMVRLGDTCVLVTLVVGAERSDIDYLPLTVDYQEKLYAGGIIKGSRWVKREGRPSDVAVLVSRLIDRGIRPLIPKTIRTDIQIIATLLSYDGIHSPDIVSAIGASACVSLSSIPWYGPISTTRIGYLSTDVNGEHGYILNPSEEVQDLSTLDLVVTSVEEKVVMIETGAEILGEDIIEKGIEKAIQENKKVIDLLTTLTSKIGAVKKAIPEDLKDPKLISTIEKKHGDTIVTLAKMRSKGGGENSDAYKKLFDSIVTPLVVEYEKPAIMTAIMYLIDGTVKKTIFEQKIRVDGRKFDEVRPVNAEVSILPRTHGSALFQRGETQVLSIATLGAPGLEQLIEGPEGKEAKRYMHHYSDAPYSYGATGRMFGPSRRAIGHGSLAEKAIEPVLPSADVFPYIVRIVSEILSENGSSSMGSVSGSSLALYDAGVPLKSAVAGVAIGIVTKSDTEYTLLADIAGIEDFGGEMDFKVAGTDTGITAIQLDVKNRGLTLTMIHEALVLAKKSRLFILDAMNKALATPRKELSQYAPKVTILTPPEDKIGEIIGPGGKNIRSIVAKTGAEINITDDGQVSVSGVSKESVEEAIALVENIYRVINIDEVFTGKVIKILPFGAVVELLPGKEGLLHISRMGKGFVREVTDVMNEGDVVTVKVAEIDPRGRLSLSLMNVEGEKKEETTK